MLQTAIPSQAAVQECADTLRCPSTCHNRLAGRHVPTPYRSVSIEIRRQLHRHTPAALRPRQGPPRAPLRGWRRAVRKETRVGGGLCRGERGRGLLGTGERAGSPPLHPAPLPSREGLASAAALPPNRQGALWTLHTVEAPAYHPGRPVTYPFIPFSLNCICALHFIFLSLHGPRRSPAATGPTAQTSQITHF